MILSKDPNLTLELDIHKLTRDELRWINHYCNTDVIDELVEKIMEYNQGLSRKSKEIKKSKLKKEDKSWLPHPSDMKAPRPKIMKKVSKFRPPPIFGL
tara:strand:+ start:233 stop:526 length:294 start_codon:yes stop_codon:yes gene_type:complete